MATTVLQLLTRIARDLHEPTDLPLFPPGPNSLWTLPEMLGYASYAQLDFLRRTGAIKTDTSISVVAGGPLLYAKGFVGDIERLSFNGSSLHHATNWDLEREDQSWRLRTGPPKQFHEDHIPVGFFEIDRIPDRAGTLRLFADKLPPTLTSVNDNLTVKDAFTPAISWAVLASCLSRDGDGQDVMRGTYAWQRYKMLVMLTKRLVMGGLDITFPSLEAA